MKPTKILSLFICLNIGLLGMVYFSPEEGLRITDSLTLNFTTVSDLTHREEAVAVDITEIVQAHYLVESNDNLYADADTTRTEEVEQQEPQEVRVGIEHPDVFENPLYPFYAQLDAAAEADQPLRILHFGDSQIEADRITGELRNQMQNRFGGCGVGLIPVTESSHSRISVYREASDNWKRHEVYGRKDKTVPHQDYGVMGYIHRFTAWEATDSSDLQTASISLKQNKKYYPKAQSFEQVSLLLRNAGPDAGYVLGGDTLALPMKNEPQWITRDISSAHHPEFEIGLQAKKELEVYGVSLDCPNGVAVDNISWRGSSGIEFNKMDKDHLKGQLDSMNVGMVIYEFGVNVVPHVIEDYSWYQKKTLKELQLLRELLPNTPILVVGVSDMARNEKGSFVSYPNVEKIRNAQRQAAFDADCSFWDLYGAMGGKNSMVSWVESQPSLAQKDYTHFNARGAKVVGEMLYQAIMEEYTEYKKLRSI